VKVHQVRVWLILAGVLAASLDAPADDDSPPPLRLEKKTHPKKPGEAKPDAKQPDNQPTSKKSNGDRPPLVDPEDEAGAGAPEEDIKETLGRLTKNLRESEERLGKNDVSAGTRQVQRDIVADLDALIERARKSQRDGSSGGGGGGTGSNSGGQSRSKAGSSGMASKGSARPEQPRGGDSPAGDNAPAKSGSKAQQGMTKIADLYKEIWGHLPESMRQEMDAYAQEKFLLKYRDLLEQYYSALAEKGKRARE
jgi:hypothetical protein